MSISTTDTSTTFTGNNSTSTAYQIPFKYLDSSHLKVIGVFDNGGELDISATCTYAGDGSNLTGEFTTQDVWDGTSSVRVELDMPLDQPVVLQELGMLPAKTIEVQGFDRLNMQIRSVWGKMQSKVLNFLSKGDNVSDLINDAGYLTDVPDNSINSAKIQDNSIFINDLGQGVRDSLAKADSALQSGDNVSDLVNDAGYLTTGGGGTVQGTDATYDIQAANEGAVVGNARGENSVDLQTLRTNADEVASGATSSIIGGIDNKASGGNSTVLGGQDNASSAYATLSAGRLASAGQFGARVFADGTTTPITSRQAHEFTIQASALRLVDGNEAVGKVLTCNHADGSSNWADAPAGGGSVPLADGTTDGLLSSSDFTKLSNQSGTNTGDEITANLGVEGIAEVATTAQINSGASDKPRIVHPFYLKNSNYITDSKTATLTNKTFDANGTGNSISNIDLEDLSATGTPSSSTYLRGDNTWATVSGGGGSGGTVQGTDSTYGIKAVASDDAVTPNTRGEGSVDLMMTRDNATEVPSANYSALVGGSNNTASGLASGVMGGNNNVASAQYAGIFGGTGNTATGNNSFVMGGYNNAATGVRGVILSGHDNTASGIESLAAGAFATASHDGARVFGDKTTTAIASKGNHEFAVQCDNFRVTAGTPAAGKVLTCNHADGSSNWADLPAGGSGGTVQGTDATYDIQATNEGAVVGNARGEGSVDLQTDRSAVTQVASGLNSVIIGGVSNEASGNSSTVLGGFGNVTSAYISLAAGRGATASHNGARVWADASSTPIASKGTHEFTVQCNNFRVDVGTPAAGDVLTCNNADGSSDWQAPSKPVYTVATLPASPSQGDVAMVTDATSTTFHTVVAGTGSSIVPVFYDGTNWRIG